MCYMYMHCIVYSAAYWFLLVFTFYYQIYFRKVIKKSYFCILPQQISFLCTIYEARLDIHQHQYC